MTQLALDQKHCVLGAGSMIRRSIYNALDSLIPMQSIYQYRSLCRSITMHASTEESGGSKSYYSICMLQRNIVLRQRLKHCKTVGAPSQAEAEITILSLAEVWLYGLTPPPPPLPLFVSGNPPRPPPTS